MPHGAPECKAQIQTDRDCSSFVEWRIGFTPTEHLERIEREVLQQSQREEREREREWREQQAAQQRQWQEEQAKREDARAERDRQWRQEDVARDRQRRQEDVELIRADMKVKAIAPIKGALVGALLTAALAWFLKGERVIILPATAPASQQANQQAGK